MARLILDAGAVIALTRGNKRVGSLIDEAIERREDIIVPPVVVGQVIRGGSSDAPIYRLLSIVHVTFTGLRLARRAGELLGEAGMSDVADALIMAEALWAGPSVLLTSHPDDMRRLAGERRSVQLVAV